MQTLKQLVLGKGKDKIVKEYGKRFWDYIEEEIGGKDFILWEEFVDSFVDNIDFGDSVLDFGCGFGMESILLAPQVKRINSIDPDREKIQVFKKILLQTGHRNINPQVMDGERMTFPAGSFDSVFCNESLSHVPHIEKALKEIRRVLKPGGMIIVADTKRWNPYGLWMIYGRRDFEENYFNIWTMKRLLREAGYKNINRVPYITCPRDPFRKHRKKLWPLLAIIDPKYVLTGQK